MSPLAVRLSNINTDVTARYTEWQKAKNADQSIPEFRSWVGQQRVEALMEAPQ